MAAVVGLSPRLGRRALIAAAAGTFGAAVSGCTPTPPPNPISTPGGTTTPAPPAARVAQGGIVRLPVTGLPTQWNRWTPEGGSADALIARAPLTAPAFTFDDGGTAHANPDLIAGATVSDAGRRTVVTLTLNPDAVWGDGSPITAADWVATFHALGGTGDRFAIADRRGWDRVADVHAGDDPHTVIVGYAAREPDWTQPLVFGPLRAESVADPETFLRGWSTYRPEWFAGPFVVAHTDRTRGVLTLQASPHWWGQPPALETVFVRAVAAPALPGAVAAGEFDVYAPGSAELLAKARTAPDTAVRSVPGTGGRLLQLVTTGVLADTALRQAITRAIDRTRLANSALGTVGNSVTAWSNRLLLPQQVGYVDVAAATGLTYDPAAAAKDLLAAGYPLVDQVRQAHGAPLRLTYTVPPRDTRAAAEAASVTADLAVLGITVQTVSAGGDLTGVDEAISQYPLRGLAARVGAVPGVAEALAGIETQTDAGLRLGQATKAARMLWQDARGVPLYVLPETWVVRTRLTGVGPAGFATIDWASAGYSA